MTADDYDTSDDDSQTRVRSRADKGKQLSLPDTKIKLEDEYVSLDYADSTDYCGDLKVSSYAFERTELDDTALQRLRRDSHDKKQRILCAINQGDFAATKQDGPTGDSRSFTKSTAKNTKHDRNIPVKRITNLKHCFEPEAKTPFFCKEEVDRNMYEAHGAEPVSKAPVSYQVSAKDQKVGRNTVTISKQDDNVSSDDEEGNWFGNLDPVTLAIIDQKPPLSLAKSSLVKAALPVEQSRPLTCPAPTLSLPDGHLRDSQKPSQIDSQNPLASSRQTPGSKRKRTGNADFIARTVEEPKRARVLDILWTAEPDKDFAPNPDTILKERTEALRRSWQRSGWLGPRDDAVFAGRSRWAVASNGYDTQLASLNE